MSVRAFLAYLLATILAASGLSIGLVVAPAHAVDPVPVTGTVVDATSDAGVSGAYVEAWSDAEFQEAWTDGSGAYGMALLPGSYEFDVTVEGYADGFLAVEVTTETTTLPPIELQPLPDPIPVTGKVVDATTGEGILDAYVWADGEAGYDEASTVADGTYSLDLRPGFYTLAASASDHNAASTEVEVTEGTTTLPDLALEPVVPGIYVDVSNDTFGGPAAGVQVVLQPAEGSSTTLATDEMGQAFFGGLASGQYTVDVIPGGGYVSSGDPVPVDYTGGTTYVSLGVSVDLSCEPASAHQGLTNMGFESGLDSWTLGYQTESIQAVGADAFTSPWEGTQMARVGQSQPSNGEPQHPGPNVMCQDFVVTDPEETFAFNVFTYDYTGFDEFKFDVVVSSPDTGEILAAYQQGAWSTGTDLKTSGWRGVRLDLADYVDDTVRLTFRAGGTSDSLFAFWAYLDSAETLPPTIELPTTSVQTETGSVTTDPVTGQTTVSMPSGDPSDITLTVPGECANPEVAPTSVSLLLNGIEFATTPVGDGEFQGTIPEASVGSGILSLQVVCEGETTMVAQIGQIVLYDPSGIVSDAVTGAPVVGAEVHLYKVPGWTPQGETGPYPETSCQTNLSKEPGAPWDQPAPTDLGELVNAASPEISPNVNPFITNNVGYYGWDVAEGCWYVEVSKNGYATLTSPVVGVPTAVTDLHLELAPLTIDNIAAPAISGTPKVGKVLTASQGTWSESGLSFAYAWLRDGVAIPGATSATYDVTSADVGKALIAKVTATKDGYAPGVATSSSVTVEPGDAPTATTAPAISGTPKVGETLTVSAGTWSESGLSFAYAWLRDGVPIPGATSATYTVIKADVGQPITAQVTATKDGHAPGVATTSSVTGQVSAACVTAQAELEQATTAAALAKATVAKAVKKVKKLKKQLKAAIKKLRADPDNEKLALKVKKLKKQLKKAKKALKNARAALDTAIAARNAAAAKVAELC